MTLAIAATLDYARAHAKPLADDRAYEVGIKANTDGWEPPPHWGPPIRQTQPTERNGVRDRWFSCPRYEFYLGVIGGYFNPGGPDRRDTIITFNYDTVIEEALEGLGLPFQYGAPNLIGWKAGSSLPVHPAAQRVGERIEVLKLHGSVNWIDGFDAVGARDNPIPPTLRHEAAKTLERHIAVLPSYSDVRTRGYAPLLVAPTWQKVFSGYLAAIWKDAVDALRTATRVIILGYSVPTTDQHFKYLMAAGLQDNISLRKIFFVNRALADDAKRPILEERLYSLFRPEHFERGVIELVHSNVERFFANAENAHLSGEKSGRLLMGRTMNPPGQDYFGWRWVGPIPV